ncbi:flagellar basal-body rod protein FlgF [Geoanaerobacter pelophilus]|nr:flagellar basal-body rod protein FlgF [Geoanaerobacter pelophilus]
MNTGMYAAISGNLTAMRSLEVISNNLANAATPGFKADQLRFESVLANQNTGTPDPVFSRETFYTDYSPGTILQTENPMDLALQGDGFFAVNTPQGTAYTRQGNFQRGVGGKLVTSEGYEVLGKNGPITVGGNKVSIAPNGAVTADGVAVGSLNIVDFPKPYQFTKLGAGLLVPANPQVQGTASTAEVKQGYLEGSNVNVVAEMARMIETSRYFETCTKAIKSYDEITTKAANDLGKI